MNPAWVIVFALLWMVCLWEGIVHQFDHIARFFRWLNGSRETYYLDQNSVVRSSPRKLRTPYDRIGTGMANPNQGVIEISRGWFRRPTAIYGDYHVSYWKIMGNGVPVNLTDGRGISVTAALRLINTYPTLQAMLDRIAGLEKKLSSTELELQAAKDNLFYANERRNEWYAGVIASLRIIERDKQYFRSQAARNIRKCLEALIENSKDHSEPEADKYVVLRWENTLHGLVYY